MSRKTGWIWMIAGVMLALVAGFLTFRTLASATVRASLEREDIPTTPVVVAVRAIPLNKPIGVEEIALRNMPTELVPSGAVRTLESAAGRISRSPLQAGEILLEQRLIHPDKVVREALAFAIPEGHVVIALPPTDLMSRLGILSAGDVVDILVSLEVKAISADDSGKEISYLVTFDAMQHMKITALALGMIPASQGGESDGLPLSGGGDAAVTAIRAPDALLFAVTPQDALIIKHARDSGGIIDLALRAPDDNQFIETDTVMPHYLSELYRFDLPASPGPRLTGQSLTTDEGQ